ncbi:MAG: hypothetical protein MJ241_04165 [Bacilli bacterium]|nr:hypothetical protein [Bacilli bacterium]
MKRCLMIVEGPYDQLRLSLLAGLFDESKLSIVPFGSDATTMSLFSEEWRMRISRALKKDKRYDIEMFDEIVCVFDLDGCYVDSSCLDEKPDASHIKYHRDKITCIIKEELETTHKRKRKNIDSILEKGELRLFYNSTNIDDAFDEVQNPTNRLKRTLAMKTYSTYKEKPKEFIEFLYSLNKAGGNGYVETWEYIKEGANSLSSASNIIVFLMQHKDDLTEENRLLLEQLISKE